MRFKVTTLNKLEQVEALISKLEFQANRQMPYDAILDTIDVLKDQLNELRNLISIEHDDFDKQF